ncbi:malate dehydrogenase [Methanolobus profundi]|uniref:Malate dehydrogenase n=1 Tax=Methanolobus profundi TaxID=487685 RepID=A0A1I4QTB4_9EURY|nr:malate dehydrogenase [Methanolobus profundi]SFM42960.1 malate dehydrogenase (NAD) [Methanolobus profundi]
MNKVAVIGSGNVGATTVQRLAELNIADIVMVDIVEGLPQGKALDILQAAPLMGYDVDVKGTNDYADIAGSDVVVITAGIARKPGMSRDDLLATNIKITQQICASIEQYAPDAIIMTVTNPLDIITYAALRCTQFDRNKVFGMSGLLDSSRFASFIAKELNCSVKDVCAMVLGGHGDSMVPLPEYSTVSGVPLSKLMDEATIERIVNRTINAGAEIVAYMKSGSAFYAPSAAIATMVESILNDTKRIVPASAFLNGEYGQHDICLGVPVKLGKNGVEEIIELELTKQEMEALQRSADAVREGISKIRS